jgi:hypothetical protein
MSWVAAQNAVKTAQTAMRVMLALGSLQDKFRRPRKIPNWASSIQLRRRPKARVISGSARRSTTGAHRNFMV